jgi:hypothetical protein
MKKISKSVSQVSMTGDYIVMSRSLHGLDRKSDRSFKKDLSSRKD